MNSDMLSTEQQPQSEDLSQPNFPEQKIPNMGVEILPIVDRLFVDEGVPEDIARAISSHLFQDEGIFVLFQLNSPYSFSKEPEKIEKVPLWTVITGTRLLLLAISSEGEIYCDTFDQHTVVEYQDGLARDEIKIADKTILTGFWEGKRKLFKEAVNLFPLSEYEKYLYIANIYLKQEDYAQAIPFLQHSLELVPTIKAYLLLAHALFRAENQDKAIEVLQQACQFADPSSVFQELQILFPENLVMFLYLAVVGEKNQWWDMCIEIYQTLLQKTPDFDLYFLKLGEMYNLKKELQSAIEYYEKFITLRTESEKFENGNFMNWDISDFKSFGADPDLLKALFDLGVLHEHNLNDLKGAFSIYLSLIRHAPFYTDAYKHFWHVYQQLLEGKNRYLQEQCLQVQAFLKVYELLDPSDYASVIPSHLLSLGEQDTRPGAYHKMNAADHDMLIHPGEREYWRRIQNWITNLVVSEEDAQGIEQYCEQVSESNYPQLFYTIKRVSDLLNIDLPRCFISRGKIGISVKNKEHPFIFIGSEHLNEGNERYFSETELLFIIAAQAEHIKSGHLLITGTDLWKSLGTASFDGFLVALQYLPAGSFIGRLTHRVATEGLKKVYKMTKDSTVQKILKFVEKKVIDRSSEDAPDIQEDSTSVQKNGRSKIKKQPEPESLLKNQIVGFARHAVYTADRVGLLACDDIRSACSAIFKLAGNAHDDLEKVYHEGLSKVLEKKDKRGKFLYFEYAKRFSELIKFALSEEYFRIHEKVVVLPEDQIKERDKPEHKTLFDKLQLLEQSRQNELLTAEEFLIKQKNLLKDSGFLFQEDSERIDKLQQACREGILTYEELQTKIFQLLERKVKGEG